MFQIKCVGVYNLLPCLALVVHYYQHKNGGKKERRLRGQYLAALSSSKRGVMVQKAVVDNLLHK